MQQRILELFCILYCCCCVIVSSKLQTLSSRNFYQLTKKTERFLLPKLPFQNDRAILEFRFTPSWKSSKLPKFIKGWFNTAVYIVDAWKRPEYKTVFQLLANEGLSIRLSKNPTVMYFNRRTRQILWTDEHNNNIQAWMEFLSPYHDTNAEMEKFKAHVLETERSSIDGGGGGPDAVKKFTEDIRSLKSSRSGRFMLRTALFLTRRGRSASNLGLPRAAVKGMKGSEEDGPDTRKGKSLSSKVKWKGKSQ
jgi:hypothetical protein